MGIVSTAITLVPSRLASVPPTGVNHEHDEAIHVPVAQGQDADGHEQHEPSGRRTTTLGSGGHEHGGWVLAPPPNLAERS